MIYKNPYLSNIYSVCLYVCVEEAGGELEFGFIKLISVQARPSLAKEYQNIVIFILALVNYH